MDSPREAVWRLRPDEPRTLWGWILYSQRSKNKLNPRAALIGLPIVLAIFLASPFFSIGPELCTLSILIYLLSIYRPIRKEVEDHAALPTLDENQFSLPVRLQITRLNRIVGADRGWITVVDGWLVYEGLRTSFSLNASLARQSELHFSTLNFDLGHQKIYLAFATEAPTVYRSSSKADEITMRQEIVRWQNSVWPSGNSVMPPSSVHPRFLGKLLFDMLILIAVVATASMVGAAIHQWTLALIALLIAATLAFRAVQGARELAQDLDHFDASGNWRPEPPPLK